MILKHMRERVDGLAVEDTFEALDERSGATLANCLIYTQTCPELFPARPLRIYIDISEQPAPDALLGAAVARAKDIAAQSGGAARIFAQVEPEDADRMTSLAALGFRDNDGLVRMRRELPAPDSGKLPYGCVLVRDILDDPIEQKYFLERRNQLYSESRGFDWLQGFRAKRGFSRILIVSQAGMVGEIIHWQENGTGVLGWLHVAKKWRRKGISQRLIELACADLYAGDLYRVEAEIQARVPNLLHTMEKAGFRQSELIYRYPGIDIN